jgi:hypothetical protein
VAVETDPEDAAAETDPEDGVEIDPDAEELVEREIIRAVKHR